MKYRSRRREILFVSLCIAALPAAYAGFSGGGRALAAAEEPAAVPNATRSSPIAITNDNQFVWSVNPDNDSVSVFRVAQDANLKVAEIPVEKEPWCVAIKPAGDKVYVTNMASGTVSVINASQRQVVKSITVGTEPFGCALTPDGSRLYVANQSSGTVSVIDTTGDAVLRTINERRPKTARHCHNARMARKVFVTQFLAVKSSGDGRPLTQSEGADDGREGRVTMINGTIKWPAPPS